jgi:hypothetical protein
MQKDLHVGPKVEFRIAHHYKATLPPLGFRASAQNESGRLKNEDEDEN